MEFFNKGRAILDIERAQRTAEESRVVNTAFEQEFLAKTGGYAELKLTDLTTGSSFVDESFNRIRTASYIQDKRYSLNPKSTTWVVYQTHPTVYEIQDTGLTASSSVWMTEETAGYCYIVGTDDDTTLTVFQFDGTSLSEITLSASISYSTNIDVATLPSGELVVFTAGTSYAIVSQNGDVTSGTHLASAVDQIFVEKVGNAVCFIGVTSGDIISGVTVDGQNYKNWDNWTTGDRSGDDGDTNSSYAVQSGTGIQIVDTHVQTGGFSALASDGTNHYLFIATNGGYQIIEPDFSDIEADISQTLTVKDKANSTIVAHGYYDRDLYTLVLDNQSTTKTLSAYRGILSQSKTLSSIEQSSTITLPTLSAPERLYGLRESFYQNSDTNAAVFSVYFGTGFVSSNILSAAEADTLQTVTDRGATTTNEIDIPSVQFDTTQTLTPTSGQLGWNADDETLDLGLNGGSVVHKLGETLFFNVKAAEAISKGDVLYASGAVGNSGKIEASKYTANNTIDENRVLGIAAEDISIGDFGFVYFLGSLRGITTDGSDVSETWVDGTILYASPSTAGALTSTQPVAPNQDIPIAFVTSAHASNGALYIRATQLGYHLGEIHDVYVPSPSDGEVLTWNNTNQRWEAGAAGGVTTVAPTLDTANTLIWDGENEQGYNYYITKQFNYARTGNIANVNLYLTILLDEEMGTGELEADLRFFLPNTMAIRDDGLAPKQPIGTATVSDGRTFMVMRSGAKQVRFYSIGASGEDPLLANDSDFMPSLGGNGYMLLQATYMAETISGTAPTANFSTSTTGLQVTYTSDAEDAYYWVLSADGTMNSGEDLRAQAITITYPSTGTYATPRLRVANNFGTDSFQDVITLAPAAPVASFTISDATPNVGQIVTFTDTSTNTPTSWSWAISPSTYVFEGGTSATSQNPQVAFLDESTNYTVNLTATNAGGSDSTAFTNNVVSNALEAVHFEYDPYLYGDADNEGTQVPTTYGSPTYNSAGYYTFDGTDDAFYYDYDNGINDATGAIEVFIDWDDTQNGAVITWGRDDASSYRGSLILRESDNTIRLFNRRGSSADQIDLKWNFAGTSGKYHIVLNKTVSGGTSPDYYYELYLNGVSQGNADTDDSTATTGVWFNDQDNYNPYNITVGGQFVNGVTLPTVEIIGDIYRAAIYEDPLSTARIGQNYNWLLER